MAGRSSISKTAASRSVATAPQQAGLAIDFERYIPTVLSRLVAKFRASSNVFFTQTYDVSLAEWRILSFLAQHGPASAYDVSTKAHLDKAVVSRESAALLKKGYVSIAPVAGDARRRAEMQVSESGAALLERSFDEILRRHDNLTVGLDEASIATFLRVAAHVEARIPHMGDPSDRPRSRHAPVKRIGKGRGRER